MGKIRLGILGMGTVGTGVWKILTENAQIIKKRINCDVEIAKILVRNIDAKRNVDIPNGILTLDFDSIVNDDSIDIIVELMGGIEPAQTYIAKALTKGKHVVTANKALISQNGEELFEMARDNNVNIKFEASVCGGIPIINTIQESLSANVVEEIVGIVNGTTNYILSKMTTEGLEFADVLKEAQDLGFAEADPTADIEAYDPVYKLMILASLAFGVKVKESDVYREGITKISKSDIEYAKELGYCIKLLAIGKNYPDSIELRVHPTLVPVSHPIASVSGAYNAVFAKGNAVGDLMFYGKGAGDLPTASAVVSDIISLIRHQINSSCTVRNYDVHTVKTALPMEKSKSIYYMRFNVTDTPGVLGKIATIFGDYKVSLASIIQKDINAANVPIVFLTHESLEENIQKAILRIKDLPEVFEIGNIIRVENL